MSIFYRGHYTIDVNNNAFIRAISKYNQQVIIQKIQYDNDANLRFENQTLENLPAIIEQAKQAGVQTIDIDYIAVNASALHAIFPAIDFNNNSVNNDDNFTAHHLIDRLQAFFHANRHAAGAAFDYPFIDQAIDKQEAIHAFKIACKALDIHAAAHLEADNIIIFEHESYCYGFQYGDQPNVMQLSSFSLDMTTGILDQQRKQLSEHSLDLKIQNLLQSHFAAWKNSNYKSALWPASLSLNPEFVHEHDEQVQDEAPASYSYVSMLGAVGTSLFSRIFGSNPNPDAEPAHSPSNKL